MAREVVYDGRVVKLGLEEATLPDGRRVRLEIIRHQGAAAVLPLHADGSVTLIEQYRHAAGGLILEIPAGVIEPGERPEVCASRELAEEARLRADELRLLTVIHTTPGFTDERIHLYLGTGLSETEGELDPDEYLSVRRMPLSEALVMASDGRITDAKTLVTLLLAARAG